MLSQLPPSLKHLQVPETFLDHRIVRKGNATVVQLLTQWTGCAAVNATWEDMEDLQHRFPKALAWGQASFQYWGLVSHPLVKADEPSLKNTEDKTLPDELQGKEPSQTKPRQGRSGPVRPRKKNLKYCSPEWDNEGGRVHVIDRQRRA